MYESSYSSSAESLDPAVQAIIYGVTGIIFVLAYVVGAFLMGRIFHKAGVPQWKAWVPVYNNWIFLELGSQKGWLSLLSLAYPLSLPVMLVLPVLGVILYFLSFIPAMVAVVFMAIAAYHIGLKLQKEGWFVVLYIFAGIVWYVWLAFDDSKWGTPKLNNANQPGYHPPAQ